MKLTKIDKKNCYELEASSKIYLFSYNTLVAYTELDGTWCCYVTDKFWSSTTSKHINQFIKRHRLLVKQPLAQKDFDTLTLDLPRDCVPNVPMN